jgi:hypothetical protein
MGSSGAQCTPKGYRYRDLLDRLDEALEKKFYFEALWIEYALIEDRVRSALKVLGREPVEKLTLNLRTLDEERRSHRAAREAFFEEIRSRSHARQLDSLLLEETRQWIGQRNRLMHDLGEEQDAEAAVQPLAKEGRQTVRDISSAVMRLKKRSDKLG